MSSDGCAQVGRAAAGEEAKQQLGGEEYFHQQFHSDFVLYNEASRRLPPLADRPPAVKADVNSNYLKVSRSNSRLTSTLKKLLPRRKTSKASTTNSEVNLTGIYNNNKYIIKVNNSEPTAASNKEIVEKGWVGMGGREGEMVRGARVNRNKSFLLGSAGNKVKRSNSVLPTFLGRRQLQDNRTVVEVGGGGGGGGLQQFPWAQQEKAKESGSSNDNRNNNISKNNNNNRYVTCMPTSFWGEGSAGW